jgi:S-DNA-T family DNA segregation ATPase FtsK/SpoIIIE
VHLVVAGRADALRAQYAHWTRAVRRSRLGVLLQPNPDVDGDLLGVQLPRRAPVAMVRGRGYVVNGGDVELAQLAVAE